MSWDNYINTLVGQSNDASGRTHVDRGAIVGLDGAPWTTRGHADALKASPEELAVIARVMKSKDFTPFQSSGVVVEGVKYQFLRVEDDKVVLAKRKDQGMITMQSTKTAVVIAHCPEGGQQGVMNKAVGVIADYLESMGM